MSGLAGAELVAAGCVFVLALILVALGGSEVYASAGRASDHLTRAAAIGAPLVNVADGAAPGGATERVTPANRDDASQRTFAQLTQYYAANLNQGQAMFWASFVAMVGGFAIVFAGIIAAGANPTTAIVGGVAGVLSQFIAATFLVALRSTQAQATAYAQTLVELRLRDVRAAEDAKSTQLGLELLGEIAGEGALALTNQTRAALAMGLIVKQTPAAAPVAVTPPEPPSATASDDGPHRTRGERRRAPSVTFDAVAEAAERHSPAKTPTGE